jgi:hypothetical protein
MRCGLILLLLLSFEAHAGGMQATIRHVATKYKVSAPLLTAIYHLESSSGLKCGLRRNTNGTADTGPFQINSVHWTTTCHHLDVLTDEGNAECAALLLSKQAKHAGHDPIWYGRYHSKTPRLKLIYANKIKVLMDVGR